MVAGGAAIARLFVGIDLPPAVKDEAARVGASMRPAVPDARWTPPENLHVTLAFLGHTPLVDEVCAAVGAVAAPLRPFGLRLDGAGAFPSARRARVLWIGLAGEVAALAGTAAAVAEALVPLGFAPETRPFAAHLTIARLTVPAPAPAAPPVEPLAFAVEAVTVFESRLGRPAPVYEPRAVCPLGAA